MTGKPTSRIPCSPLIPCTFADGYSHRKGDVQNAGMFLTIVRLLVACVNHLSSRLLQPEAMIGKSECEESWGLL